MKPAPFPPKLLNKNQRRVWERRNKSGKTFAKIGEELGLQPVRTRQIWEEARVRVEDYEKHGSEATSMLPARAQNLLRMWDIKDRTTLRDAFVRGDLKWDTAQKRALWRGKRTWNVGWVTWKALVAWAGLPIPQSHPSTPKKKTEAEIMQESISSLRFFAPVFYVRKVARSVAFYRDRLSFQVEFSDAGEASVFREGCRIRLRKARHGTRADRTVEPDHVDILFGAHNIVDQSASFAATGAEMIIPKVRTRHGCDFYIHDPDGHVLGFVQVASTPAL